MLEKLRWIAREPAMLFAVLVAGATAIGTFVPAFGGVDVWLQGVFNGILTIGLAIKTRPIAPAWITGLLVEVVDLLARFGLHLDYTQVGSLNTFFLLAIAYVTRSRVTPKNRPAPGYLEQNPT